MFTVLERKGSIGIICLPFCWAWKYSREREEGKKKRDGEVCVVKRAKEELDKGERGEGETKRNEKDRGVGMDRKSKYQGERLGI